MAATSARSSIFVAAMLLAFVLASGSFAWAVYPRPSAVGRPSAVIASIILDSPASIQDATTWVLIGAESAGRRKVSVYATEGTWMMTTAGSGAATHTVYTPSAKPPPARIVIDGASAEEAVLTSGRGASIDGVRWKRAEDSHTYAWTLHATATITTANGIADNGETAEGVAAGAAISIETPTNQSSEILPLVPDVTMFVRFDVPHADRYDWSGLTPVAVTDSRVTFETAGYPTQDGASNFVDGINRVAVSDDDGRLFAAGAAAGVAGGALTAAIPEGAKALENLPKRRRRRHGSRRHGPPRTPAM